MAENGGTLGRKRSRQGQLDDLPLDDTTGSTKKRRLTDKTATTPAAPTPTSGFRSLTSAISNVLGLNRSATATNGHNGLKQTRSHEDLRRTSREGSEGSSASSATMPTRRSRQSAARPSVLGRSAESIYDIPASDEEQVEEGGEEEQEEVVPTQAPAPPKQKTRSSAPNTGRRTKRKPKGVRIANGTDEDDDDDMPDAPPSEYDLPAEEPSPKKRGPGRPPNKKVSNREPPAKATTGRAAAEDAPTHRTLRRKRGIDDEVAPASSPVLKGILTPSKGRNNGGDKRRKTVAFGEDARKEVEEIFFQDLPTTKKTKKPRAPAKSTTTKGSARSRVKAPEPQVEVEDEEDEEEAAEGEDDEDDEICEICLKPDSEPGNEIIFCDNCDLGYHQKCQNVSVIPDGDWICKSCLQEDASKTPKKSTAAPPTPVPADAPDIPSLEQHLKSLQRVLLDRCTGQKPLKIQGQDEAYTKVHQVVEQTIVSGEGNSMLLIGGRGCGKTALIEDVVATMKSRHGDDFHVVRLDGFIHTDDKLALKDIWRQLGKEMEVDDELVHRSNYADTMVSLLALLSHPAEIMGDNNDDEELTSQSVIFIINEFDMFAYHPRQTLLYNLFDIAQARKAPIAVLGCTTRLDVVEMLEKRVKSRFSHRYAFMAPPKSLPAYWDICRQGLIVDKDDAVDAGLDKDLEGFDDFMEYWSRKIERLHKQEAFQRLLNGYYYTSKSIPGFLSACILPIASLTPANLSLRIPPPPPSTPSSSSTAAALAGGVPRLAPPSSKLHLLSSLSDLDLALLVSAARLDIVAHTDTVNFAMAYDEYGSLMGRQRVQSASSGLMALGAAGARVWGRAVAVVAWERLADLGLLVPAGVGGGGAGRRVGAGGGGGGHGGVEGRMFKLDVSLEEIPGAASLNAVLAKWCREI